MTKILGLSGKKQSGKNTSANYIVGVWLKALGICKDFSITSKGNLLVTDTFGIPDSEGIFDINHEKTRGFCEENLDLCLKVYSFADFLKKNVCMDILGLTREQCYGTDEDKNTQTHLKWEDMPGVVTAYDKLNDLVYHEPGPMTAREVLQFVGTEIFRKMYYNVWVDATLRQINKDSPEMAVICDVRFKNEADSILNQEEGKVVRFTRNPLQDNHESETNLDDYNNFSYVIDNSNCSIEEQNRLLHEYLEKEEWIPTPVPEYLLG